jgi:hypothetical protein
VGGFSTGSITEDFKTSLNLCAHGFQCKYFLQVRNVLTIRRMHII